MDPKQFRTYLESVAELKQITVPKNGANREAQEDCEVIYQGETLTLGRDKNPTLNFRITKLKCTEQEIACPDCGLDVIDHRTEIRLCEYPEPHWRETCVNCRRARHPETGEFTLNSKESVVTYRDYLTKPELRCLIKRRGK